LIISASDERHVRDDGVIRTGDFRGRDDAALTCSDVREIQFLKNNYGRQGDSIQIRWDAGVFVLENAPGSLEKIARDTNDDHRFLELLAKYEGQGRKMSHKIAANDYAPRVFAAEKNGISLKRFEQTMERLFEAKKIHAQSYGPPSKQRSRLVLGPLEAPR
jgi:RecA-family ATPase